MKYKDGRLVMVPWIDASGETEEKNWSRLRFYGTVDHRRVKRELRKFVKQYMKRNLHPQEQRNILKFSSLPLYAQTN